MTNTRIDRQTAKLKDRVERARKLVDEGRVDRHGDLHVVAGNGGNYTVNLDGETCSCKAGRAGMACYHLSAAEIFESRDRCRRAKVRKDRRHANPMQGAALTGRARDFLGV